MACHRLLVGHRFYDLGVDVASGRGGEVPARGVFEGREEERRGAGTILSIGSMFVIIQVSE